MLLQFKFKNHKCFLEENILDLMATKEKRHLESTIDINGNKILPVVEIHGANASGKSSLLEAMRFMFKMIKSSSRIDINNYLPVKPFLYSNKPFKQNSEYEISIYLNDYEYRYGFSLNLDCIEEEWLYKKKFSATSVASQKVVFERYKDEVSFGSAYNKYEKTWNLFSSDINIKKMLVLSNVAIKEEEGIFRSIYNFASKFYFSVENIFEKRVSIRLLDEKSSLYDKFQNIIKEFDPCLVGIDIDEKESDTGDKSYNIMGIHKNIDNDDFTAIPLEQESAGTIKIFNILPIILKNLEVGGVLSIDELDIKLHPLLFKKIVSMYMDKKVNKNNAQLIYTAHSTFLFNSDTLRRDQLYLVDKNSEGKANLYSLSEFRKLRVDADYEKKYLSGQFGAIPFI